jgi:hypothetical protein
VNSYTATAAALLVAACAARVAAQDEAPTITQIAYGELVTGHLGMEDDSLIDGSFYRMYVFNGETGDSVTVSMSSRDFNTQVLLTDSLDKVLDSDDNSGGECNSHLTAVLPVEGFYVVYATSAYRAKFGEFELSVQKGMHAPASTEGCGGFFESKGTIAVGDSVRGTLGPPDPELQGSYYQVWDVSIPVGDTATIDLRSGQFDALLVLYRGFASALRMNDDGGGACHARLVVEGPDYPIKVMVRSSKEEETGEFQLRVVPGALPVVEQSQCLP